MESRSVLSNFFWRFAERIGAQGVKMLVEIVLARILLPEDYGIVAIVTIFITILQVFVDSGLANALIQKKDADDLDFSSVFWFNIVWCLILYGLMFLAAPLIAAFYNNEMITPVLRVLGIQVIIASVKNVELAYVSRTMQFKRFFFATLGGTIGAAVVGIWMAYNGYGVWALVAQHIFNTFVDTVILFATVKWHPKWQFSFARLKGLLSFGWKLLAAALLDTIYTDIRQLIIGKVYTEADLAFYNRGQQYPQLAVSNINASIDSVLLPTMSREQDHTARVKAMTSRAIKTSTYLMAPLMLGLAVVGEPLIRFLLTEKWLPSVFYMQIFCLTFLFYPLHTANLNALKAMGRGDLFLKLEILKKVISILLLAATVFISVEAIAYSMLVSNVICMLINAWPNRKILNYGFREQIRDILPSLALAAVMSALVWCVSLFGWPDLPTLVVQIVLGAAFYAVASKLLRLDTYEYILELLRPWLARLKRKKT